MARLISASRPVSTRSALLVLVGAVLLCVPGCSPREQSQEEQPVPVEVRLPERMDLSVNIEFVGEIRGRKEANLSFEIGGKVARVEVDVGRSVGKGDVLAVLDETKTKAHLLQAEVAFSKAKLDAERTERLHKDGIASDHQLETARLTMEQARASFVSAEETLRDCTLRAPFSGFVASRNIELGEVIVPMAAAAPNFVLLDISSVKVKVGVPESDMGKIEVGQSAALSVSAYPDIQFEGRVSTLSPLVGEYTRTAEAEIVVENPGGTLKPGMTAKVSVRVNTRENALVVPESSVRREVGIATLFVVKDGRARELKVETGIVSSGAVEVLSGLSEQDSVVVKGQFQLKHNSLVRVTDADTAASER
ncbi:MAG: efflux RND transporter periplasmic adaptor subunit [Candidatus Eiseniibacteriota bacterium]|nr:MAG: efflux RND transporter periplasmic adaptor subunit [Candidatus Eisenbacteria bacterium]